MKVEGSMGLHKGKGQDSRAEMQRIHQGLEWR
jgi:hypothetical protein